MCGSEGRYILFVGLSTAAEQDAAKVDILLDTFPHISTTKQNRAAEHRAISDTRTRARCAHTQARYVGWRPFADSSTRS